MALSQTDLGSNSGCLCVALGTWLILSESPLLLLEEGAIMSQGWYEDMLGPAQVLRSRPSSLALQVV